MEAVIRVAICDDDALVRTAFALYVEAAASLELVASCASGAELLETLEATEADVLLLDVRMSGMDGPATAREVAGRHPGVKVLYLTSYPTDAPVEDALTGTVMGALTKDLAPASLASAIECANQGMTVLGAAFRGASMQGTCQMLGKRRRSELAEKPRDAELLDLMAAGRGNRAIAKALFVSESTVKQAIARLSRSAGVPVRSEFILYLNGLGPETD